MPQPNPIPLPPANTPEPPEPSPPEEPTTMLDVHPPHNTPNTWRDFFIHIATIVVGLCIAVGLEQTVEAIHHRHLRNELTGHMREEAEHSLPVIHESLVRLEAQRLYIQSLHAALASGKVSGTNVAVSNVPPRGGSAIFVSVSRSTWITAQAAGLVALLPSDQAKLYARIDFNAEEALHDEDTMYDQIRLFLAECSRANYDRSAPGVSNLTIAHRNDLLFQLNQLETAVEKYMLRLSLLEGADESVVAGVLSVEGMYRYQGAAMARLQFNSSLGSFYGGESGATYKQLSTQSDVSR